MLCAILLNNDLTVNSTSYCWLGPVWSKGLACKGPLPTVFSDCFVPSSFHSPILSFRERFDPERNISSSVPYSLTVFGYSIFSATYVTNFLRIHSRNKAVTLGLFCFNWQVFFFLMNLLSQHEVPCCFLESWLFIKFTVQWAACCILSV